MLLLNTLDVHSMFSEHFLSREGWWVKTTFLPRPIFDGLRFFSCCILGIRCTLASCTYIPVESLFLLLHRFCIRYIGYCLDHIGKCMRNDPLEVAERNGQGELVILRINRATEQTPFVQVLVLVSHCSSSCAIPQASWSRFLSRSNSVLLFDFQEVFLVWQSSAKVLVLLRGRFPHLVAASSSSISQISHWN